MLGPKTIPGCEHRSEMAARNSKKAENSILGTDVQRPQRDQGDRYREPSLQENLVPSNRSEQALPALLIFEVYMAKETMGFIMWRRVRGLPWFRSRHVWCKLFWSQDVIPSFLGTLASDEKVPGKVF